MMESLRLLGLQYVVHSCGNVHQADYVQRILEKYGMADRNPDPIPMDPIIVLLIKRSLNDLLTDFFDLFSSNHLLHHSDAMVATRCLLVL